MPIMRTYECPDCNGRFRFLHMTRQEPPPAECELCGADMGGAPEPALAAPAIGGSAIARSVDKIWNDASKNGVGNMRDGLREGDVAAPRVSNPVTQYAEQVGHQYFQGGAGAGVRMPTDPNVSNVMTMIQGNRPSKPRGMNR